MISLQKFNEKAVRIGIYRT